MLSKKLFTYINTFSSSDIRKLEKFIQSPYHNEIQELSTLYSILKPSFLNGSETIPQKKEVWSQLFPNKPYSDVKIRKMASLLLNLAIEFKAYETLKARPEQKLLLELLAVSRPGLSIHIAGVNRKLAQTINQNSSNSAEYNFYRFRHSAQNHRILELENNRKKLLKLEELHQANEYLDIFYYAQKMALIADIIGYQGFMNISNQPNTAIKTLDAVKNASFFHKPIIQVYYLIIRMLSNKEQESFFFELKDWLQKNNQHFSKSQKKTFYAHLINYCISHQINKGNHTFFSHAFEVLSTMVSQKLIFDPFIDPNYYRNIITIGLQIGKFEYIRDFISTHSSALPPEQKENAETYNLARLYYKQKQYDKVLELLHNVELTNISYALGAKTILIGTYFALDEYRALESLLISFRIFILRNKLLAKNTKQSYLNFLKFTKKLIYLAPYDKESKEKLKETIIKNNNVAVKDWLLEQINNP